MTAYIIAVMVVFILSLGLSLINILLNVNREGSAGAIIASGINCLLSLGFITWSIILLAS
jgi:hypothetical protein